MMILLGQPHENPAGPGERPLGQAEVPHNGLGRGQVTQVLVRLLGLAHTRQDLEDPADPSVFLGGSALQQLPTPAAQNFRAIRAVGTLKIP